MPLLEIHDLEKGYPLPDGGRHPVLRIRQFQLNDKDQIALRGESGSGKTTFLNLIAGILQPDRGKIEVAARDIAKLSETDRDRFRAGSIGYIFQTFNLLPAYTCLENVLLGMTFSQGADRPFAEHLLQRMGLRERLRHRPHQLSVGQQQRVAVARALANRPKLVLADEPTGNLDRHNAREALDLIRESCAENGAALLLVSHDSLVLDQFKQVREFDQLNEVAA